MTDPNLILLQSELARIDVLLRCYVQRRQLLLDSAAGMDQPPLWPDEELDALLKAPLGSTWEINGAGLDETPAAGLPPTLAGPDAHAEALAQEYVQILHRADVTMRQLQQQGEICRIVHLQQAFGLTQFEFNAFLIVLAATLDPRYARLYAQFLDDITLRHATVGLVLDILCLPGLSRLERLVHFGDEAPLIRHQLLEIAGEPGMLPTPLIGRSLTVPACIVTWLFGHYQPHPVLAAATQLMPPGQDPDDALMTAEVWPGLCALLAPLPHADAAPVLCLYGADLGLQAAAARRLAVTRQRSLLTLDLAALLRHAGSPLFAIRLALRDARLAGALIHLQEIDSCVSDTVLPQELWAELCAHPDLVITTARQRWRLDPGLHAKRVVWMEFAPASYRQRQQLWRHFLQDTPEIDEKAITLLAGQFDLPGERLREAIGMARASAAQRGQPLQIGDFITAARAHSTADLSELARRIIPRYRWRDLILPENIMAVLREVVAMIQGRGKVLEEWGLGQKLVASSAVTVLFSGEPGTGKTMAAEVLAGELGLELYTIDLAALVSKYIGETEKNLERIFTGAEQSNAILFFDEADSVFGKRSSVKDAHDRYANIGVSYLLQRMEAYRGITILATNLRANLDEAFTRRLQFAVDFPFPDVQERLRIWLTLTPRELPLAPDVDFEVLAQRFKFAGGNIRNAIVTAAYLAAEHKRSVTMEDMLHGVRRELRKMGRLVQDGEFASSPEEIPAKPHESQHAPDAAARAKLYRLRSR